MALWYVFGKCHDGLLRIGKALGLTSRQPFTEKNLTVGTDIARDDSVDGGSSIIPGALGDQSTSFIFPDQVLCDFFSQENSAENGKFLFHQNLAALVSTLRQMHAAGLFEIGNNDQYVVQTAHLRQYYPT